MSAFIQPPKRIPLFLKFGIWLAKKVTSKEMLPAKLLSWYPKAAVSSGIMESLAAHHDGNLDGRILKLVRLKTSFIVSCPFCIDMNSFEADKYNITEEELQALQGRVPAESIKTFSDRERAALLYVTAISSTPLSFEAELVNKVTGLFAEREIIIIASTAAQVNYWARLIQALGIPPAGFTDKCRI